MKSRNPLPETIGPYRITGRLGRGGMGEVLRAYDDRLGRSVAIKRVHPDVRNPDEALRRFQREARTVARLSHPAIVQVYDWAESAGQYWLVMELIEGDSLDDVVAEGPLSVERALEIARDVASALAEAHDASIVHRDLKTSNVILTPRGRAKVLDFGLARPVVPEEPAPPSMAPDREDSAARLRLTGEGRILGTVGAMSPEQALGRPVDYRSDLFSLGILLYEMLSGSSPFEGRNAPERLNALCNAQEEPLHQVDPGIPEAVSHLVAQLLEKDPARRPRSAHRVVAEIDRLSEQRRQRTTRLDLEDVGLFEPQGESPRRRRWRAIPLVFLVVVFVLVLWAIGQGSGGWKDGRATPGPATPESSPHGSPTLDVGASEHGLTKIELYQRGVEALERSDRRDDIDAALRDFQAALALDPGYAPALAGLSRAYRLDHYRGSKDPQRLEQALAVARRAVAQDEHLAIARVSLGQALRSMGRLDEALLEFESALELEPSNASALFGLGRIHGAQGDDRLAEESLLRAIEAEPEDGRFQSFLGVLYYRSGRYDEAVVAFRRHLEKDPDAFVALSNLGATYYMQGRLSEAAEQFQKALVIEPDPTLYSNVGTIFFTQGLYAQAASAFEKAIENGRANDPLLWGNLGDARRFIPGRSELSRDAYLRAIQLLENPSESEDSTLHSRLVLYRAKKGECEGALAEADRLGEQPGLDGHAWFRLAVAREVCGRREAALEALKAALEGRFSLEEIQRDPELMDLRQDVRYHRLARDHSPEGAG
jgi:serine/threonine-protein kinase